MKKYLLYAFVVALVAMTLDSCSKSEDSGSDTVIYGTSTSSALLTSFSLKANTKVLDALDSIHFTIDQQRGLVYNADSLPKGTDVTKLLTTLSFGATVKQAVFVISNGERVKEETSITYKDSSTDSIDFSGDVMLNITSSDGTKMMRYKVMVNVHKCIPDSVYFPLTDRRDLPAAADDNYALGMTQHQGTFYSIVNNSNGMYLATASTPAGKWDTKKISLPFTPDEASLISDDNKFYILDNAGNLYSSTDCENWTAAGVVWNRILGVYDGKMLGLTTIDGNYYTDEYPRNVDPKPIPDGFPITGSSQLMVTENDWAVSRIALMVGGRDIHGTACSETWGYDGNSWASVSSADNKLPALDGPSLFSYYTYDVNSYNQHAEKKATWVVMGGRLSNGTLNTTTYVSRNLGITWTAAASGLQLPSYIPAFSDALAFVCTETASAKSPARISKPVTEWDVPYMYIVGGHDNAGRLHNNVWKGVIVRLTFKPVY